MNQSTQDLNVFTFTKLPGVSVPVEYRLRWVPNAKLLRWPCTFHVFCVDFICVWCPTQTQFPVEYGLKCVVSCRFFNVAYTTSAWLVAGVAVERFLAVWYPLSAQVWCTVKNTVITVVIIPLLLGAFYAYNFWMWQVRLWAPRRGLQNRSRIAQMLIFEDLVKQCCLK